MVHHLHTSHRQYLASKMVMASLNEKKHLKEQFVSNLSGSSALEISTLITALSVLIVIRRGFGFNYSISGRVKKDDGAEVSNKNWGSYMAAIVVDFVSIVIPTILFMTVLAEWTYWNAILVFFLLLLVIVFTRNQSSFLQESSIDSIRRNMSSYRVATMVITCVCILAVDFKIFPRRYAKTETYGTSLMDLGVGSFVVTNSLVSRQARGISDLTLRKALFSASPLIIIGFTRLICTTSVNYQVHVGEYGVHWNFFFTLAAVAILTSIFNVPSDYCGILGFFILVGYQVLLLSGLNEYLLSEDRKADLISQNKEGIYSIAGEDLSVVENFGYIISPVSIYWRTMTLNGYWGMYLIGVQLGSYLFFGGKAGAMSITKKQAKARAWAVCLLFWSIYFLLDWKVEKASRRMSNMAYVFFVWAVNLQVLAVLMLSDYIPGSKTSALEEAVNRNLLAFFLLANVLTGLVNLSIDTLSASPGLALAILNAYAFVLSFAVGCANFLGLKLKFW